MTKVRVKAVDAFGSDPDSGTGRFLMLNSKVIKQVLSPDLAIELTEKALRKTSDGTAKQDIRRTLSLPGTEGNCLSVMYAALADRPLFGAKVLSVYPGNFGHGLPSHQGMIILFESAHGRPAALIDGGEITAWRTAAASAVATRVLSRANSSVLAVLGYGEQAQRHVDAISCVRPISRIRVWGRDLEKARQFAAVQAKSGFQAEAYADPQAAIRGADVICTTTSADRPILHGSWLDDGVHVNAVGASVASIQEIDSECIRRSRVWVDYLPMALQSAGELIEALQTGMIERSDLQGELGDVLSGKIEGRRQGSDITLYRSLGVPAQDIELANFVYTAARDRGLGIELDMKG